MGEKKQRRKEKSNGKNNKLHSELSGILWISGAAFLFFSLLLPDKTGIIGGFLFRTTTSILGKGAYLLPFVICIFAIKKMLSNNKISNKTKRFAVFALYLVIIGLLSVNSDLKWDESFKGAGGGVLGFMITWFLQKFFAKLGSYLILLVTGLSALLIIFNVSIVNLFFRFKKKLKSGEVIDRKKKELEIKNGKYESSEEMIKKRDLLSNEKSLFSQPEPEIVSSIEETVIEQPAIVHNNESSQVEISSEINKDNNDKDVNYQFPPVTLLTKREYEQSSRDKKELQRFTKILEDTLLSFGVNAKVAKVSRGPTITRYEVQPASGVKVSKIVNLSDDIALSMAAADVRIEAPIPNKSAVGIEVPNKEITTVYLRDLIESSRFQNNNSKLSIALGKDVAGGLVFADLQKMPHLLIAGATGTGKSVCINTVIASLLFKARPDEVKLLMIDPKVVELNIYNNIPHLISPVVTDPKKAAISLKWIVAEMENRYSLFASSGTRDIQKYNEIIKEKQTNELLPYIVVVIDELADLMMVAPNDVEDAICRIAQMARAAGIHLVIATQRPSVDVITGLIKANIPSRISFSVSSQVDSRTILDLSGAEKLLGKGDMLYFPSGASKPLRVQGCFVSDQEVEAITSFWKKQGKPEYTGEVFKIPLKEEKTDTDDELFKDALRLVIESNQASVSLLQRRLRIGYTRAARLIDALEDKGYIGPYEGSKPREVLITSDSLRIINEEKEQNK